MSALTRKQALRVALEPTPGTYETPDTDILWTNPNVRPAEGTMVPRDVMLPHLDRLASLRTGDHATFDFEVELAAAGAPGDAPPWAPLLMACGFAETSVTNVTGTLAGFNNSTNVATLASGASSTDDAYNGRVIKLHATGSWLITDYVGSSKQASLTKLGPASGTVNTTGDSYEILAEKVYNPISEFGADSSLTAEYFQGAEESSDAVKFTFVKSRGTVSATISRQKIPMLKFSYTAFVSAREDDTMPSMDYSAWADPIIPSEDNGYINIHGYTACLLAELSVDVQNSVNYTELCNTKNIRITGRDPKGNIQYEAVPIADHDFYSAVDDATTGILRIIHGTEEGGIIVITAPMAQVTSAQFTDVDGIIHAQSSLEFKTSGASAGNDSIQIKVI